MERAVEAPFAFDELEARIETILRSFAIGLMHETRELVATGAAADADGSAPVSAGASRATTPGPSDSPALQRVGTRASLVGRARASSPALSALHRSASMASASLDGGRLQRAMSVVSSLDTVSFAPGAGAAAAASIDVTAVNWLDDDEANAWFSNDLTQLLRNAGGGDSSAHEMQLAALHQSFKTRLARRDEQLEVIRASLFREIVTLRRKLYDREHGSDELPGVFDFEPLTAASLSFHDDADDSDVPASGRSSRHHRRVSSRSPAQSPDALRAAASRGARAAGPGSTTTDRATQYDEGSVFMRDDSRELSELREKVAMLTAELATLKDMHARKIAALKAELEARSATPAADEKAPTPPAAVDDSVELDATLAGTTASGSGRLTKADLKRLAALAARVPALEDPDAEFKRLIAAANVFVRIEQRAQYMFARIREYRERMSAEREFNLLRAIENQPKASRQAFGSVKRRLPAVGAGHDLGHDAEADDADVADDDVDADIVDRLRRAALDSDDDDDDYDFVSTPGSPRAWRRRSSPQRTPRRPATSSATPARGGDPLLFETLSRLPPEDYRTALRLLESDALDMRVAPSVARTLHESGRFRRVPPLMHGHVSNARDARPRQRTTPRLPFFG